DGLPPPRPALPALGCAPRGTHLSPPAGRQPDGASATIRQLQAVVEALDGRLPILLDGGIRSGVDILKALALGAQGVMIGRPWAWALAAGGEAAVAQLLASLQCELAVAMALCGVKSLAAIDGGLLAPDQRG